MAQGYLICKVCGKEYPYCMTNVFNAFRWQDVACCEEHAKIYFDLVAKARAENIEQHAEDAADVDEERIVIDEAPKPKAKQVSKKNKSE